jgi:hypothetical protein
VEGDSQDSSSSMVLRLLITDSSASSVTCVQCGVAHISDVLEKEGEAPDKMVLLVAACMTNLIYTRAHVSGHIMRAYARA